MRIVFGLDKAVSELLLLLGALVVHLRIGFGGLIFIVFKWRLLGFDRR